MSFKNYLIFDLGFSISRDGDLIDPKTGQILRVGTVGRAECATKVEWEEQPGQTEEDKIRNLTIELSESSDLLFLPSKKTAENLALNFAYNYINKHVPRIRDGLLKLGGWTVLRKNLKFSDYDEYALLLNTRHALNSVR